jgi:hypothetical protein
MGIKKDKNKLIESKNNTTDTITMDVPLFIRMLEYAKEDAKTDMDLHIATEKAIELLKNKDVLTMDSYDCIVGKVKKLKESTFGLKCDEDDLYKAVEIYAKENRMKIERRDGSILLHQNFDTPMRSFESTSKLYHTNMTGDDVRGEAKRLENIIQTRMNNQFKDFCDKGLKGVVGTFQKGIKTIVIYASVSITYGQLSRDKSTGRAGNFTVFKCTGTGCNEIYNPDSNLINFLRYNVKEEIDVSITLRQVNV